MFASIALFSWPLVVLVLFQKYRTTIAIAVSIVAGYLLLPSIKGLDLPLLPVLDKHTIPALAALVFAYQAIKGNRNADALGQWIPHFWAARVLLVLLMAGAMFTVLTNGDRSGFLPGLRPYDGFSAILGILMMLIPFFLAYRFIASPQQQRGLLAVLAVAGVCYSFLALYEIRMSPQLNHMIYGFFPHSWLQHVRAGGYRPLVFLDHGLWLAIFFAMSIISACGAAIVFPKRKRQFQFAAGWIFLTLLLSNSLGSLVIAFVLAPIVLFLPYRTQILMAFAIGLIVLSYPMLRERGIITGDRALSLASKINAERAGSLEFRLENENILLEKANQRPVFGWGGWGRARVYNEAGEDVSVTDGYWVIIFGIGGWTRYISEFGLLILPLGLIYYRRKSVQYGPETVTLAIVLCANLVDLIPNGTMTSLTWLVAGSLWGRLDWGGSGSDVQQISGAVPTPISPYTRQTKRINRRQTL